MDENAKSSEQRIEALSKRVAELEAMLTEQKHTESLLRAREEELRLLVECSPYCIHQIDKARQLSSMNRAGLAMMNAKNECDVIGLDYLSVVCEEDLPRISELLERAFQGESSKFEFSSPGGQIFSSFFIPMTVVDGEVVELMGLTQDVTDLRTTIRELRESEELNRRIIEALPGGIFHITSDGRVIDANTLGLELLGMTEADLHTTKTLDFEPKTIWEDGTPCLHEDYPATKVFQTGEAHPPATIGVFQADGSYRWALFNAVPIKSSDTGEVVGAVVTSLDITERKQQEEERKQFEAKLMQSQKLESLGVLAGGIAHDFNNLLVGVLGNAGLASMELDESSPVVPYIQQIEEAAMRASELTNQMLAYAGKGNFQSVALNLSKVASEMIELLSVSIPKSVVLERHLADDLPWMKADPTQIRQVVMNLVLNAAEAIEGVGKVTISTGTITIDETESLHIYSKSDFQKGPCVFLEVKDSGCGIEPENISQIFDPFFSEKTSGRGLGLSVVLGVIRRHRGALRINSEPGKGSRFQIFFPITSEVPSPKVETSMHTNPWGEGRVVLLIDDDESVRRVIAYTLNKFGFKVLEATDGVEGLEMFDANQDTVDLVLLDLVMPRMGGLETLRGLRKIQEDVKVILSSGHTQEHTSESFEGEGLSGFIGKPFRPQQLLAIVKQVLHP